MVQRINLLPAHGVTSAPVSPLGHRDPGRRLLEHQRQRRRQERCARRRRARLAHRGSSASGNDTPYGYALQRMEAPMATAASRAPRAMNGAVTSRGCFWMVTSLGSSVKTLRSWAASSAL